MSKKIEKYFDSVAKNSSDQKQKNAYYYNYLEEFYGQIIPEGSRVLEIGCGVGDLLAKVQPSYGLGVDISGVMIDEAKKKYPHLDFLHGDVDTLTALNNFDFIILSNLLDYVDDIYAFFNSLKDWTHCETKIIINNINPLWAPAIRLEAKLWLKVPDVERNFVTILDINNILDIVGFDIIESGYRLFCPIYIPFFSNFINKLIPRLFGIKNLSSTQYVICRIKQNVSKRNEMSCSVVIPSHNEEGNIEECVKRVPSVGAFTEIIVVDDGSTDDTFRIANNLSKHDPRVRLIRIEKNLGKGNAVREGFDNAKGDVLMILDADMTVMPEEIPRFFDAIADGQAEFVNGTRMVYSMERGAMKFANFLGNKAFGIVFSIIMGQRNTDTLCGTKAFLKRHYSHIDLNDCKWGDFDLLYGAAKLKLKMVEMPVHYKKRIRGDSKMKVVRHGIGMAHSCWKMFRTLK